jgi:hypothetical protein
MAISLTNITGGAQTGFTTPGYNVTLDSAADVNGKQWAISGLTGTQTGVTSHSPSSPFTWTYWKPKVMKLLPAVGVNGQYSNVPSNKSTVVVRKGVLIAANQPPRIAQCRIEFEIPAGAESYDSANVKALISAAVGALNQQSAGIGDTITSGIF